MFSIAMSTRSTITSPLPPMQRAYLRPGASGLQWADRRGGSEIQGLSEFRRSSSKQHRLQDHSRRTAEAGLRSSRSPVDGGWAGTEEAPAQLPPSPLE